MYQINPLKERDTGAEILGIDLSGNVSNEIKLQLNKDFARYHVLVIRNQSLGAKSFATSGEIFGTLMAQHHKDKQSNEHPFVFHIKNEQIAPGKYRVSGENFHTDHSNHPCPPKATALFPISLPSYGGDTQFLDMQNAYDDLSDNVKDKINSLKAIHTFYSRFSPRKVRALSEESSKALPPPSLHPIVRIHPVNGRKSLYLNPLRMDGIVGWSDEDAVNLFNELMAHCTQPSYEYRHHWLKGDFVIWDNRCLLHQANGDYDMNEVRHLYRMMVEGEPLIAAG